MEGSPVEYKANFEADKMTLKLANIEGDLAEAVADNLLDGAAIRIVRINAGDAYAADKEIVLFNGTLEVDSEGSELDLTCYPSEDSMNIKFPPFTWQEPCNYCLFDANCELVQSNFLYQGTASGGSVNTLIDTTRGTIYKVDFDAGTLNSVARGETITGTHSGNTGVVVQIVYLTAITGTIWYVRQTGAQFIDNEVLSHGGHSITANGTPAEDITFYEKGEIQITSGANNGQRRMVLNYSGSTLTPFTPFSSAIVAGVTYNLYPGCDYTWQTCKNRFNNVTNFFGFPGIPKPEEIYL
jgi:hypothetical protein